MPELIACPSCDNLVFEGTCTCPHCGVAKACTGKGLTKGALLMGISLSLTGCVGGGQALYGVPVQDSGFRPPDTSVEELIDNDGDGYDEGEDCDDDDAAVNPGATETPGDKLDSNCDGNDDT